MKTQQMCSTNMFSLPLFLCVLLFLPALVHAAGAAGSIQGTCFIDMNDNGAYDPDEAGLEGVTVTLKKISLASRYAGYSESAVSAFDGTFEWNGLSRGLYLAEVQQAEEHICTTPAKKLLLIGVFKKTTSVSFGFAPAANEPPPDSGDDSDTDTGDIAPPPPPIERPTIEIEATPVTIIRGESASITWQARNAATVMIAPGIGKVSSSGSLTVVPLKTTTYYFTVFGFAGIRISQITIKVLAQTPPGTNTPDPDPPDNDIPGDTDDDTDSEDPTLVALSVFTAHKMPSHNRIVWETVSEIACAGFNVYRTDSAYGQYRRLNTDLIAPCGSSLSGADYLFIDSAASATIDSLYILEEIDLEGGATAYGPIKVRPAAGM
jgi:hypothetical protein